MRVVLSLSFLPALDQLEASWVARSRRRRRWARRLRSVFVVERQAGGGEQQVERVNDREQRLAVARVFDVEEQPRSLTARWD